MVPDLIVSRSSVPWSRPQKFGSKWSESRGKFDHISTREPAPITTRAMEEVPPTCFVIRPHHIQNLMIIGVVFQEFRSQKIPPQFMIHVYRLLMQEIAEVSARQYALSVSMPPC